MDLDAILETAAGREAAEKIKSAMKENGIYFAKRENLDLRFEKLKSQREELLRQKEALALALEEERNGFTKEIQERQLRLEEASKKLLEKSIEEEIQRTRPKSAALFRALITAGETLPDEEGNFSVLRQRADKLLQEEPYLFAEGYAPAASASETDPALLSDAEYFQSIASNQT